ncbi:hypothetical protein ELG97_37050 [Rhizobium leguminosarum]|uniref:hypothetical protein n=1 Tax=Rhizobium leguminosarum TaxID=384 RepID=UPI001030A499|nr:hypothetical protein [Rhizobium leguminosarum]TBE73839.1 hypothetical protein ELG97_37050 [Rhizobium leguminosarum]
MTDRQPNAEQIAALEAFAAAHGRKWKDTLSMTYWYNARIWRDGPGGENMGAILHGVRNQFGGSWLYDEFKLPKKPKAG